MALSASASSSVGGNVSCVCLFPDRPLRPNTRITLANPPMGPAAVVRKGKGAQGARGVSAAWFLQVRAVTLVRGLRPDSRIEKFANARGGPKAFSSSPQLLLCLPPPPTQPPTLTSLDQNPQLFVKPRQINSTICK